MSDVTFPKMSEVDGTVGVVVTWFAQDGDRVEVGDLLGEVAVDKVDAEVRAEAAGTFSIVAPEESEVAQGAVIATIT